MNSIPEALLDFAVELNHDDWMEPTAFQSAEEPGLSLAEVGLAAESAWNMQGEYDLLQDLEVDDWMAPVQTLHFPEISFSVVDAVVLRMKEQSQSANARAAAA